ncbi:transcription factor LBX1 [Parasteatoda tepidariorum]|uniref:transcription factor LBX1 n=1 Tax=Parasteatoda tepidariorum TaxID=114398 RepID=UPI001C72758E|nr:transcription factor LBX1-like [Parasteatoda tepidariorum]
MSSENSPSKAPSDFSENLYDSSEHEENGTDEYFKPIKKLRMIQEIAPPPKPITSFLIRDILNPKSNERNIVRPWDLGRSTSESPLDALFEMTNKAFEGLEADDHRNLDPMRDHLSLFSSRQQPKKKRKSRTAFTNHQIYELEKRFLYQKYLAPADRDEISQSLGLTNAQVITWFQNRRAKLKRDMEELKKDVDAAKVRHEMTDSDSPLDT